MKQQRSTSPLGPTASLQPELGTPQFEQPYGNSALAESMMSHVQQEQGDELAMGRGHAAGLLAGFGIAALNAVGSGGPAALSNPNSFWGTHPDIPSPSLVSPAGGMIRKP